MITLARGPDGFLTTTLPDHRSRDVRYRLRPLPEGTGVELLGILRPGGAAAGGAFVVT